MKGHYLSVTTLEEYEPNPEFIGRNFNNGEIIQLVLRSKNGGWVPFRMVQMVMMHELAHNTHMNHGREFWKTRNIYAEEMKGLWAKGYTGEGFWGSGRTLSDLSEVLGNNVLTSQELEGLPLCGGTYRSRRRKRRAGASGKPELTWKEKKERRIEKKFGKNGVTLGEDEDKRVNLEINRKGPVGGKPRVAQSKRGRELRAAAALARFETNKQEVAAVQKPNDETEDEEYDDVDGDVADATDVNGKKILDSQGHGMIRITEEEDTDDVNVRREMEELEGLDRYFQPLPSSRQSDHKEQSSEKQGRSKHGTPDTATPRGDEERQAAGPSAALKNETSVPKVTKSTSTPRPAGDKVTASVESSLPSSPSTTIHCPICSLENPRMNATCMACAHVLDPKKDPRHWSCQGEACKASGSAYLNAGDAGVCGICGARRGV